MTIVGHFDFNRTAKIESLEKRSLEMAPRLFDGKDFDLVMFSEVLGRGGSQGPRSILKLNFRLALNMKYPGLGFLRYTPQLYCKPARFSRSLLA